LSSKVSQYTLLTSPASDDELLIVDVSDTSTPPAGPGGSDKRTTVADLLGTVLPPGGVQTLSNGSTVTTGSAALPVTASAAVSGLILQPPGTAWCQVTIVNQSAYSLTFAASGTSNVADGTSDVIAALTAATYIYDGNTSLWARCGGGTGGGGGGTALTRATVLTASGSAAANTIVPVNTTSGAVTVTLPHAPAQGAVVAVKCITFGTGNPVSIATGGGSDVFNKAGGSTTLSNLLNAANAGAYFCYDATSAIWTDLSDDLPMSELNSLFVQTANGGEEMVSTNATASGAVTLNLANGNVFNLTVTGNITGFTFSGATSGVACGFTLYLTENSTGGYTISGWPGSVTWIGGTAPTLNTAANALNILTFQTLNGGTNWYGSLVEAPSLPLTVPNGGTGAVSITAGEVVLGGTTNYSPLTTVSGVGTALEVLTSDGTSGPPYWAAASGGFSDPMTTEGDLIYENATPAPARLPVGLANQMLGLGPSVTVPGWVPGFGLLATVTGTSYALVNGTGTIVSWSAPSDGNLHLVFMPAVLHVTSAETGGAITYSYTLPDGTTQSGESLYAASTGTGIHAAGGSFYCEPGSTFTVSQSSALTAGVAVLFLQLWGY
jgi:hypothetical protein